MRDAASEPPKSFPGVPNNVGATDELVSLLLAVLLLAVLLLAVLLLAVIQLAVIPSPPFTGFAGGEPRSCVFPVGVSDFNHAWDSGNEKPSVLGSGCDSWIARTLGISIPHRSDTTQLLASAIVATPICISPVHGCAANSTSLSEGAVVPDDGKKIDSTSIAEAPSVDGIVHAAFVRGLASERASLIRENGS